MIRRIERQYNACVSKRKVACGYRIKCKRGLWAVYAPTKEEAERQARHYWIQYLEDGEYGPE